MSQTMMRQVAAGVLSVLALSGCASVWTYDAALVQRWNNQNFSFVPPDSVAFPEVEIPLVYDVVFDASDVAMWDSQTVQRAAIPAQSTTLVASVSARTDTVFIFVPDTTLAQPAELVEAPPAKVSSALPVQIDLTEAQEAALLKQTEADIKRAEELLQLAASSGVESASRTEQMTAARGLITQARSARDRNDYQGAASLAKKARLLLENLAAQRR